MTTTPEKIKRAIFLLLILLILEGLAALGVFLSVQSMGKNAVLFGYSLSRLVMASLFLFVLAALAWMVVNSKKGDGWLACQLAKIYRQFNTGDHLVPAAGTLFFLFLLGTAVIIAARLVVNFDMVLLLEKISPQAPGQFQFAQSIIKIVEPFLAWAALAALQAFIFLLIRFPAGFTEKWKNGALLKAFCVLAILVVTIWHWLILFFQLETLLRIPGWKWYFEVKSFLPSHWIFAGLFTAALLFTLLAWRVRQRIWLALVLLAVLGAGLQIGFGFIEGQGFESLRVIYSNSVFNNYAEAAARRPDFLEALLNYEQLYGDDWYLGTKPPGVILVYNLVQRSAELFQEQGGYAGRFYQLTSVIAHLFPLLSMLVLIPLYHFNKSFSKIREDALLPGMLLVSAPTMILIPLFLDQALYPLMFMAVLLIVQRSLNIESLRLAFLAGLAGYLALYFSFSMLVLLPLSALWILFNPLLQKQPDHRFWQTGLKMLLCWGAGLIIGFVLLRIMLDYDILVRFTHAMQQHRLAKNYDPGIQQVFNSLILNNAEFLTWNGIPLVFAAVIGMVQSIKRLLKKSPLPLDGLTVPFLITFVVLNFTGQTDGEVQRLWLFMLPVVCTYAAGFASSLYKNKISGILLVVILELITTFFLFKFQNFYG